MNHPTLIHRIEKQAKTDARRGRRNHFYDLGCIIGGVGASFAAALLAVSKGVSPLLVAGVAAVPGLCAGLQRLIDFHARSEWFFVKAAELRGIALSLQHEGLPEAEGSRKYRELEVDMEKQWPQVAKGSRAPAKPGA